ncbi:MAG: hypothetical protein OEQ53_05435 [Saprospiraceae bacterium]|nr:hypothetical protein [Saprospiraceae bacterium]
MTSIDLRDQTNCELVETHISYVILTANLVLKIKKPMKYSFLDFSSLAKRRYYCEQELVLNRRLEPAMYLDVVSIRRSGGLWYVGGRKGQVVDYAVRMKRLDNRFQMDVLVKAEKVLPVQMEALASKVAAFHEEAQVIYRRKTDLAEEYFEDFRDLQSVEKTVVRHLGAGIGKTIGASVRKAQTFLQKHAVAVHKRMDDGFIRDVHGDLHSRNVFMYDPPVIFDCIEFNTHFRQIDVLSEIGFMIMDLEAWGAHNLGLIFLRKYLADFGCIRNKEEESLLTYFKAYRANVRAKVNALRSDSPGEDQQTAIAELQKYLDQMNGYMVQLNAH